MDVQKIVVLETSGVSLQRVPTYEGKHSVYVHAIFCTELPFTTKIIKAINTLPLSTKRIIFLNINNKNITTSSLKLTASCYRILRVY